jgi:hypothetical protein
MGGPLDTPFREHATVESFRNELAKIIKRTGEFDGIYPGHGIVDAGTIVLNNILETCDRILENPANYDVRTEHDFGPIGLTGFKSVQYGKMIYHSGHLMYSSNSVYMNREAKVE